MIYLLLLSTSHLKLVQTDATLFSIIHRIHNGGLETSDRGWTVIVNILNPILHGGGWIPPLLTLVLNSVSGIQAIVWWLFLKFIAYYIFIKIWGYGVFRFHGNGLLKGYFYEILSKIMLFSFTVNFSSDPKRKWILAVTNIYFRNFNRYNKL